jgi:hypothetical protein
MIMMMTPMKTRCRVETLGVWVAPYKMTYLVFKLHACFEKRSIVLSIVLLSLFIAYKNGSIVPTTT